MQSKPDVPYQLHHFIEPLFWASFVSLALVGCSVTQALAWARTSWHSDPAWIRAFVCLILSMSVVKSGCDLAAMHDLAVVASGSKPEMPATSHAAQGLASFIVTFAQCWQLHRTLVVCGGRKPLIATVGAVMLAVSFAATVLFVLKFTTATSLANAQAIVHVWNPFASWVKVALDLFLSASFTLFVLRTEQRALDASLRRKLRMLALTALQAFLPCTFFAICRAIAGYTNPESTTFAGLLLVLAPLYCVSILHTLNMRERMHAPHSLGELDRVQLVRLPTQRGASHHGL